MLFNDPFLFICYNNNSIICLIDSFPKLAINNEVEFDNIAYVC